MKKIKEFKTIYKERNIQLIKEAIMQEAAKQCDCYFLDVLVFFSSHIWREFIKGNIKEIILYIGPMGIEWRCDTKNYRSKAILKHEKDTIELILEA